MRSILRMIGISIIFWFGLSVGSANAATSALVSSGNGDGINAVFSNHAIGENSNGLTTSTATKVQKGTTEKGTVENGGFGIARSGHVHLASLEIRNPENHVFTSGVSANPENHVFTSGVSAKHVVLVNDAKSSPTASVPLRAAVDNYTSHTGNDRLVSDYQTYAMLLVGLGLVGFTARSR